MVIKWATSKYDIMYYEDPLFAEEWGLGSGPTLHYAPILGDRTWDMAGATSELVAHANIESPGDQAEILLCATAALDSLDGSNGLGVILQTRTVVQPLPAFNEINQIIGPATSGVPIVVEWRESPEDAWEAVAFREWTHERLFGGRERIRVSRDVRATSWRNWFDLEVREPLARISYTSGMADSVIDLPDDLRFAIYRIARQYFDYRDDAIPSMLTGRIPRTAARSLSQYRVHWQ